MRNEMDKGIAYDKLANVGANIIKREIDMEKKIHTATAVKDANVKLSFIERFGYGIGDYAGNLIYSAISAFLLVYYTNVVGASAAAAASIIAISKFFDGISDLVMGYIIDHTHTKLGKAKPWIKRLFIPLAVCQVLMFTVPSSWASSAQLAYMFLTYNLVSTVFYTGINVPYATMQGLMTTNSYERGLLGTFRNLLATAGTMTINTVTLKMTAAFGGGDQYSQRGWTLTTVVLMLIFCALTIFQLAVTHERVDSYESDDDTNEVQKISFGKGIRALVTNKYWVLLVINILAMYFMMSTFFGSAVYFAQYILGDTAHYTPVSNALSIAQIATLFVTPVFMKKLGKRNTFLIGDIIALIGFGATGFVGANVSLVVALSAAKGIGFGFMGGTMFGLLQDAITYGEWKQGFNIAGMGNAASSFCMKSGSGVGTAALGWILAAGKFDASLASQTASAAASIKVSFILVPVITSTVCLVCTIFFDLDKKYNKIASDLAAGKHMND